MRIFAYAIFGNVCVVDLGLSCFRVMQIESVVSVFRILKLNNI